jgi:hypothetical protein
MKSWRIAFAAELAVAPWVGAARADLAGQWTTDGRYVFSFERVSFFVVHDAARVP